MIELMPLLTYSVVMSSTPGPNNLMLTTSGANFGYRRTLPHILGLSLSHAPQIFVCCMGLGALFTAFPMLHQALRIVGAALLLYLAWRLASSAVGKQELQRPFSFWQAAAFQMVNPKSWVKSITVATAFMPPGMGLLQAALWASVISALVSLPCISMWALFGVAIRGWLADPLRRRIFNAIMAASLVVLAIMLLMG